MRPDLVFDLDELSLDFDNPLYDIEAIREVNPQRFEMEQLTGVLHMDLSRQGLVGFKDVTHDEFWVRGHMPDFALMPGVIQCEAAAQLAGFYARINQLLPGDFIGFGGMGDVRFRRPVLPGSRLILMAKVDRIRGRRRAEFSFQGIVDGELAFHGTMMGVPIDAKANAEQSQTGSGGPPRA